MKEKLPENCRLCLCAALVAWSLLSAAYCQENETAVTNQPVQADSNQIASQEKKMSTNAVAVADETVSSTNAPVSLADATGASNLGMAAKEKSHQDLMALLALALDRLSNSISGNSGDTTDDGGAGPDRMGTKAESEASPGTVDPGVRKAPLELRLGSCCEIKPNPELKGRLGRVLVTFPKDAKPPTHINVCSATEPEKTIGESYGEFSAELLPGQYVVYICGKRVDGVEVKAGNDTRVRTGVLNIHLIQSTYVAVFDQDDQQKLAESYGAMEAALPPGKVNVHIAGQFQPAIIKDGQVTDF